MATKIQKFNPWIIVTIMVVILLGGVIAYDRSPAVHNGVNGMFGFQSERFPVKKQVRVEVLSDKTVENPPYDIHDQLGQIETEFDLELVVSDIDITDEKGKQYIEDFEVITVPVVLFESSVKDTEFFTEAEKFLTDKNNKYMLRTVPIKYLKIPDATNGHVKGAANPKVTIVEYSSFSCPYCSQMKAPLYQILEEYPSDVQLVYKQFNRGGVDPVLENAGECAAEQGKFWELHDYIFDNQKDLATVEPDAFLTAAATAAELNLDEFNKCVEEVRYEDKVKEQTMEAIDFGVDGTPSFFINDQFIGGAASYETLKTTIESLIR